MDVFNGDADGLCALHQLRLAAPCERGELVTGVKRDIKLLSRLQEAGVTGAKITVLDISLDSNRLALQSLLITNHVRYIDHHHAGRLPDSANLEAHIHPEPELCTSLIVDQLLTGRYRPWAVTGAFGDNLHDAALRAAEPLALNTTELTGLQELGELLNYNSYGKSTSDLYFHPATLYSAMKPFTDPRDFLAASPALARLRDGYRQDWDLAQGLQPFWESQTGRAYRFPDLPWCRRVAGVYINEKARADRQRAQALLVDNGDGTILVSLRAPLNNRTGADTICRAFPSGGGRPAAAGINELPEEMLVDFLQAITMAYTMT
ncbi:MAG: acetyltransferase [Desulfobulbaceae bacterium]|nr:acetyltransferase [Desulfobulbaceae bacterium]